MKYIKRITAFLLTSVLMLGLLAGCSSKKEELTLRVSLPEGIATLDPAMVTADAEKIVVTHLFENLLKFTNDGQGGVQVASAAARSYQCEENLDGTETYTFTLRSDGKWSNGQPVTAADFVFAWQRLVDPAVDSPNAELLDMVEGYSEVRSSGDVSQLQVSAEDEKTLVVVLSHHCSYFAEEICTAPATMPVYKDAVAAENWSMDAEAIVANGAYREVREWGEDALTVDAAEDYYDYRRLGPKTLEFLFFENEKADFRLGLSEKEIEAMPKSWESDPYPLMTALIINQMAQNTENKDIRQALSLVIDRNALTESLPTGSSYPAEGLIPYGIRSTAGPEFRTVAGPKIDNTPEGYDSSCETAQELMKGQKHPAADALVLTYEAVPEMEQVAKTLQKTWKEKLNLSVLLRPLSTEEMNAALCGGDFAIVLTQLHSDRGDPVGMLSDWCSGDIHNWANIHSKAYDLLIRVSNNAASNEARDAYLSDAETMLLENGYVIPLYSAACAGKLREGLVGLVYDGMGIYHFSGVIKETK